MDISLETEKDEYEPGEPIEASLTLKNDGSESQKIHFSSGQRYDFVLENNNKEVWRWSSDKVFTMAIGKVTLKPGERFSCSETLPTEDMKQGTYKLIGIIPGKPGYRTSKDIKIMT